MLLEHSGNYYDEFRRSRELSKSSKNSGVRDENWRDMLRNRERDSSHRKNDPASKILKRAAASPTRHNYDEHRLMTDRSAYISFLEVRPKYTFRFPLLYCLRPHCQVQLDKVASACMTAQGFAQRIGQLQQDLTSTNDKVLQFTGLPLFS